MKRLVATLSLAAVVLILAGCAASAAEPSSPAPVVGPAVAISAKDLKFSTSELVAPANSAFSIVFDNQEGAPHNVAIYKDSSASQKVFAADPVSGPTRVTWQVSGLAAGTYFFRCDVHTDMKGTLTVK